MRLIQFIWGCVTARFLASCVSPITHITTTTYDIRQSAVVPAPTPMYADAPLTPLRSVTVEGGATFAQVMPGGERREGTGGHVVPVVTLRGRVAIRPHPHFEVAFLGEGSNGAWAAPHARDVRDGAFDLAESFRLGTQVRAVINPRSPVRVGVSSSFLGGRIPSMRLITAESTSRLFDSSTGMISTDSSSSTYSQVGGDAFVWINAALFLTGDLGRAVSVLGGISMQNQPAVTGSEIVSSTCTRPAGSLWRDCVGETPDDVPVVRSTVASTVFLSGEVRLGAGLSMVGRFHAVVVGDPDAVRPGRFGGGIDLRGTIGY